MCNRQPSAGAFGLGLAKSPCSGETTLGIPRNSWWIHGLQLSWGNRWAPMGRDSTTVGGDHDEHPRERAPSRCGGTGTPRGAARCGRGDRWDPGERHARHARTRRGPGTSWWSRR